MRASHLHWRSRRSERQGETLIIDTATYRQSAPTQAARVPAAALPASPVPAARRSRRWFLAAACATYLIVLLAVCFTMRLEGDRWWVATVLLLAPRWPLALPLLVLWPWSLVARRWGAIAATAAATGLVLFPLMGLRISLPRGSAERGQLRLLTCNAHRQHLDTERFAAFVAEVRPDIVALQGWSETGHEGLFAGGDWEVRREGELLVASRFPIATVAPLEFADTGDANKGERGAAATFEIKTPQGPVSLISLHLASPHGGLLTFREDSGAKLSGNVARRWRESDRLLDLAQRVQNPLLMAGDFNTTDDSPIFREHWGQFADAFSQCGLGFGYTYIIGHTQLRIDHILAGPSWRVIRCWTGPDVGAAHRPLVADLNGR